MFQRIPRPALRLNLLLQSLKPERKQPMPLFPLKPVRMKMLLGLFPLLHRKTKSLRMRRVKALKGRRKGSIRFF